VTDVTYDPASHYDRVTAAWGLLLGPDLHYGLFSAENESLGSATQALTDRMAEAARIQPELEVLDIGCGTGGPACCLGREYGARVTGITTSSIGVEAATARAAEEGLSDSVRFELRDGTATGLQAASVDRAWVLESSHLMADREQLLVECSRILRPGGRLALCDIVLRRPLPFLEVRRLRQPLTLLREVFGDAHMEPLERYAEMANAHDLIIDDQEDLTTATRPTFARWEANARRHRDQIIDLLSEEDWERFVQSCAVLAGFWDDGTLGYGLISGTRLNH
jgi:27-O-demethylrifamycin SV methyltransferase